MTKKKRSAGAVILSFLSGLVSLILILVLAVSVALNIAFYTKDKPVEINIDLPFYKNHSVYFINNSGDLQEIEKGSLVTVDPELPASKSFYVLCTIGNDYKTILAVTDMEPNSNGTVSYTVRGTKPSSTVTHTIPQYKIQGVVKNQNQQLGDLIAFATDIKGAIALMAIPSFLLILLSIAAIRRNKNRYEDELVESEILIEELRKMKKGEEKKKKEEAESAKTAAEESAAVPSVPAEEAAQVPAQEDPAAEAEKKIDDLESEMNRKALAIKDAMNRQMNSDQTPSADHAENKEPENTPVPEKTEAAPAQAVPVFQSYESVKEQFSKKKESDEAQKEFNVQMAQLAEKQQQMAMMHEGQPAAQAQAPSFSSTASAPSPAPVPEAEPVQTPAYSSVPEAQTPSAYTPEIPSESVQTPAYEAPKKKKKRSVASIKADSFDDLIKMLDNEKKKL